MTLLPSLFASLFSSVDGTLLNTLTVLIGGSLGALIGDRLPVRFREALFGALGLFTVLIGLLSALTTKNPLIVLGALLLGVLIGEALNIERGLERLGAWAQRRLTATPTASGTDSAVAAKATAAPSRIGEAFVTASLVFCVGPLTILGSLDNGLSGDVTKLAIKATLDGFTALAIGATLGWGVLLSALAVLLVQGAISLAARAVAPALDANPAALVELTATGGVLLMAIGLKLLKLRDLRVANWLPALLVAPLLVAALTLWQTLAR